jgi:hypothetical protein
MTPKEKAEELIRKYYSFGINKEGQTLSWNECKQCAFIAIEEILDLDDFSVEGREYWQEVKEELQKL